MRRSSAPCARTFLDDSFKGIKFFSVCVIRLSLGKLVVNFLQVVKRTNTPLIYKKMASTDHGFLGRGFESHHSQQYFFSDFPHVELEKYYPWYPQEMKPLGS